MQVTTESKVSLLPNPDHITDINDLRTTLKSAYGLLNEMADSTRHSSSAIHHLMGVIAPVLVAHQQGDRAEVKRLLDAYIASGEVELVRVQQPAVH